MDKNTLLGLLAVIGFLVGGILLHNAGLQDPLPRDTESVEAEQPTAVDLRRADTRQRLEALGTFVKEGERSGPVDQEPTYVGNTRFNEKLDEAIPAVVDRSSASGPHESGVAVTLTPVGQAPTDQDEPSLPETVDEQAKALLGIDAEKLFGVDMEAERGAVRDKMGAKVDTSLEKALRQQGIPDDDLQNYLRVRRALKRNRPQQSSGVRQYDIAVDDDS